MSLPIHQQPLPQGYGQPQSNLPLSQYGASPNQFGAPPDQYGAPPGQYGAPPGQYRALPGQYGAPPGQYGAPPVVEPGGHMPPQGQWFQPPSVPINCPPGLEYLTTIDQLLVHQKVELLEAFTGFETNNKYTVKNVMGQNVYYAVEDNDCCTRNCCGTIRPFDMKILDNNGHEVIHLNRGLRCDSCCCPCCLQELEVTAPPGHVIGYVTQEWSIFKPKYRIENAARECILRIEGPFCTYSICGDVKFQVLTSDGTQQVGKITKQWSGLVREAFTDADNFGVSFPIDLDVNMKAVMLGACFLIDFMFFENSQSNENGPGVGMMLSQLL